jgi:hypothetical protein
LNLVTTDAALSPDELAEYFKQPFTNLPGYKWQDEALSKDKVTLLYYCQLATMQRKA